jgi:hypothetical protein
MAGVCILTGNWELSFNRANTVQLCDEVLVHIILHISDGLHLLDQIQLDILRWLRKDLACPTAHHGQGSISPARLAGPAQQAVPRLHLCKQKRGQISIAGDISEGTPSILSVPSFSINLV